MARYWSAHHHLDGCEPLGVEQAPAIPGLSDKPVSGGEAKPEAVATARTTPPRTPRARPWMVALVAAAGVVLLLGGLMREVYGHRAPVDFVCPSGTSEAVRAATGCLAPAPMPPDDFDEE